MKIFECKLAVVISIFVMEQLTAQMDMMKMLDCAQQLEDLL